MVVWKKATLPMEKRKKKRHIPSQKKKSTQLQGWGVFGEGWVGGCDGWGPGEQVSKGKWGEWDSAEVLDLFLSHACFI